MIAAKGGKDKGHSDGTRRWNKLSAPSDFRQRALVPILYWVAVCHLSNTGPMVSLREQWPSEQYAEQGPAPDAQAARWMSLRHASCYLDVCPSTLRRRIRKGELPWRIANHGHRWAYEVLVPDGASPCARLDRVVSMEGYLHHQAEKNEQEIARLKHDLQRQEEQIENLAQALARARAGDRYRPDESPYAKYRQLALPRRRWWFF